MENKDRSLLPTWISAIAAVAGLIIGGGAIKVVDSNEISELNQIVSSLKTPGKNPKVEQEFEFRLDSYRHVDREVVIELLVTSLERNKQIYLYSKTRLIDNNGNVYNPFEILLGNKSTLGGNVYDELPADVPIRVKIKFENISSKAEGFNLFEIYTNRFSVPFSNGDFIDLKLASD